MASTYSTNLGIELIGTGEQSGTWGTTTNNNLGTLLEQAISGYVTQACTGGTDTITIPNGSTGVARNMYLELTTTGGGTLVVPANKKLYFVFNNTAAAITVKVSGQTGVSVPAAAKMTLVNNGIDVVSAVSYFAALSTGAITAASLTLTTPLAVTSGGTGSATVTANNVVVGNSGGTGFSSVAPSTSGFVLSSNGTAWVSAAVSVTTVTGTLPVANGGTGVTSSTGSGAVVLNTSPTLVSPALGTPSALVGTNITGTAASLTVGNATTASTVTTNANLTGPITSSGNATSVAAQTGTGSTFVMQASPSLTSPALGTPSSGVVTNLTGTASININGTVGATTANTGAFTTLTSSSDATINSLTIGRGAGNSILNAALGTNALYSNTTGIYNVAVGTGASQFNTSGSGNVPVGYNALVTNTTGSYNLGLGYYGGSDITTGSGNMSIGGVNNVGGWAPVFPISSQNNYISFGSTSVSLAYINTPWTVISDARDKTNFAAVPHGLNFINQLLPIAYQLRMSRDSDEPNGGVRYGFKAQDILALEGESPVIINNYNPDKLGYNSDSLVPVLVKAIQELTARLVALESI